MKQSKKNKPAGQANNLSCSVSIIDTLALHSIAVLARSIKINADSARISPIFLTEFTSILEIANLLILATRHLGWQQVATKWQQTQKSAVFGPNF